MLATEHINPNPTGLSKIGKFLIHSQRGSWGGVTGGVTYKISVLIFWSTFSLRCLFLGQAFPSIRFVSSQL